MSQATFDDDELFGEAATEMRADVEDSLAAAWASLPDAEDVWSADGGNVLGVLNGLKSSLDAGDAEEDLRDAKKWYTMGQRADAFEDSEDLEREIGAIEDAIADIEDASDQVSELTATIPQLRATLTEANATDDDGGEDEGSTDEGSVDEANTDEPADADESADGDEPTDAEATEEVQAE